MKAKIPEDVKYNIATIKRLLTDLNRTAETLDGKVDLIIESLHVGTFVQDSGDYRDYEQQYRDRLPMRRASGRLTDDLAGALCVCEIGRF